MSISLEERSPLGLQQCLLQVISGHAEFGAVCVPGSPPPPHAPPPPEPLRGPVLIVLTHVCCGLEELSVLGLGEVLFVDVVVLHGL